MPLICWLKIVGHLALLRLNLGVFLLCGYKASVGVIKDVNGFSSQYVNSPVPESGSSALEIIESLLMSTTFFEIV